MFITTGDNFIDTLFVLKVSLEKANDCKQIKMRRARYIVTVVKLIKCTNTNGHVDQIAYGFSAAINCDLKIEPVFRKDKFIHAKRACL